MKLRYRIESRGYFIPQYSNKEEEWKDFLVKHVTGELREIAQALGKYRSYSSNAWHFTPNKDEKIEDMSLFFQSELKACAFLGSAKVFFSDRTKEFEP